MGDMKMHNIEEELIRSGVEYELIHHEKKIQSSKEGAEYFNIEIGQTAPTLILYCNKGFYAAIISGNRSNLDFKIVEELLKCSNVRLATKKEVLEVTGYAVGSVPIINKTIPSILDKQLFQYSEVYGGTGNINTTLKVSPKALIKLNRIIAMIE